MTSDFTISIPSSAVCSEKRNVHTDRTLRFGESVFHVHDAVIRNNRVLAEMMHGRKQDEQIPLSSLLKSQPFLSARGIDLAIHHLYGHEITISPALITDLLAVGHAFELVEIVDAIEEGIVQLAEKEKSRLIALEHAAYNLSAENKDKVLQLLCDNFNEIIEQPTFPYLTRKAFDLFMKAAAEREPQPFETTDFLDAMIHWCEQNPHDQGKACRLLSRVSLERVPPRHLQDTIQRCASLYLYGVVEYLSKIRTNLSRIAGMSSCAIEAPPPHELTEFRLTAGGMESNESWVPFDIGYFELPPAENGKRDMVLEMEFEPTRKVDPATLPHNMKIAMDVFMGL